MIIFLDENLPKHLAEGFQILQKPEGYRSGYILEVRYVPEEFGYGSKDQEWIPQAGNLEACVITQDININRRKHEMELYRSHGIGMFFLRGPSRKTGLGVWQMLEALAKNWPEISRRASTEKRPFAYEFGLRGGLKNIRF